MGGRLAHFYRDRRFGENWFAHEAVYRRLVAATPWDGWIVEVGAWKGRSTAFLAVEAFNKSRFITLDVVDTWLGSAEHAGDPAVQSGTLYETFLRNMAPLAEWIHPVRMPSVEAAATYADGCLDAVFIDASHDYESVRADILAWRPKVRAGGILAGHDYGAGWPGVQQAVDELLGPVDVRDSCWIEVRS